MYTENHSRGIEVAELIVTSNEALDHSARAGAFEDLCVNAFVGKAAFGSGNEGRGELTLNLPGKADGYFLGSRYRFGVLFFRLRLLGFTVRRGVVTAGVRAGGASDPGSGALWLPQAASAANSTINSSNLTTFIKSPLFFLISEDGCFLLLIRTRYSGDRHITWTPPWPVGQLAILSRAGLTLL